MKNLIVILFVISLCSCKDDTQNLLNDISGKWKVSNATFKYGGTMPDSIVNSTTQTYFEFISCKSDNNNSATAERCDMFYSENGKSYSFKYVVQYLQNNYSNLAISTTKEQIDLNDKIWQSKADIFLIDFAIENYTRNSMTLTSKSKGRFNGGIVINLVK